MRKLFYEPFTRKLNHAGALQISVTELKEDMEDEDDLDEEAETSGVL